MIDTKELRRLAQAATPGPWVSQGRYIGTPRHMSYIGEVRDQCGNWSDTEKSRADAEFIAAANPAAISELLDRLEAAESECLEQARLNGMGGEREAALMAKLEAAKSKKAAYKKAFEVSENTTRDLTEKVIPNLREQLEAAEKERDELRAKVEAMERQRPLCITTRTHLDAMEKGVVRSIVGRDPAFATRGPNDIPLYALPGAKRRMK